MTKCNEDNAVNEVPCEKCIFGCYIGSYIIYCAYKREVFTDDNAVGCVYCCCTK